MNPEDKRRVPWRAGTLIVFPALIIVAAISVGIALFVDTVLRSEEERVSVARVKLVQRQREFEVLASQRQSIAENSRREQQLIGLWKDFSFGDRPPDSLELTAAVQSFVHEAKAELAASGIPAEGAGSFGFETFMGEVVLSKPDADLETVHRDMVIARELLSRLVEAGPVALVGFDRGSEGSRASQADLPAKGTVNHSDMIRIRVTGNTEFLRNFLTGIADQFLPCALVSLKVKPAETKGQGSGRIFGVEKSRDGNHAPKSVFHRLSIDALNDTDDDRDGESSYVVDRRLTEFELMFVRTDDFASLPVVGRYGYPAEPGPVWTPPIPQGMDGTWLYEVFSPPRIYIHPDTGAFESDAYVKPPELQYPDVDAVELRKPLFSWQLIGFVEEDVAGQYVLLLRNLPGEQVVRLIPGKSDNWPESLPEFQSFKVKRIPRPDGSLQQVGVLCLADPDRNGIRVLRTDEPALSGGISVAFRVGGEHHTVDSIGASVDWGGFSVCLAKVNESLAVCEWEIRHNPTGEIQKITTEYREERP